MDEDEQAVPGRKSYVMPSGVAGQPPSGLRKRGPLAQGHEYQDDFDTKYTVEDDFDVNSKARRGGIDWGLYVSLFFIGLLCLGLICSIPWLAEKDRSRCRDPPQPPAGFKKIFVRKQEFEMFVRAGGDHISRQLDEGGYYEIRETSDLADFSKIGVNGTFVDIGANVGWYSMLFARMGWNVLAVEPQTRNKRGIDANLCLHKDLRERINVVQAALGAKEDQCVVWSQKGEAGKGRLACDGKVNCKSGRFDGYQCNSVRTMTLDRLLAETNLEKVDVLRIGVAGHVCDIFRGGQTLFEKYAPKFIIVEKSDEESAKCTREEAVKHKYSGDFDRKDHLNILMK